MGVVVTVARTGELVALEKVKAFLRVDHAEHDALIRSHVEAAAGWLDGPTGWLGRALGAQTLRLTQAAFGGPDGIHLPCEPVNAVSSVTYRPDVGGDRVTWASDAYELVEANRVRPIDGADFPSGRDVEITYTAGYATLPDGLCNAILMHVRILYDQPEDRALAALERTRDALLNPFRVWRV